MDFIGNNIWSNCMNTHDSHKVLKIARKDQEIMWYFFFWMSRQIFILKEIGDSQVFFFCKRLSLNDPFFYPIIIKIIIIMSKQLWNTNWNWVPLLLFSVHFGEKVTSSEMLVIGTGPVNCWLIQTRLFSIYLVFFSVFAPH